MIRRAVLTALAALLVVPAAAQAVPDQWTRWQSNVFTPQNQWRDSHVRALDHTWGGRIWAGTEGNGVFTGIAPGLSWTHHSGGLNGAARDIRAFHTPTDGTVLAGTSVGVFQSVNEGAWTPLGQGAGADKLNAGVQALTNSGSTLLAGVASGGVWKSSNGGNSWTATTGMLPAESVWALVRHPAVQNRVFAGTQSGVYRSENGGSTWTLSSDGLPFANVYEIAFDPANPLFMYVATSSAGVFKSLNGGLTWINANGPDIDTDLGNLSVQSAMAFPGGVGGADSPTFFAGTNDGVWVTTDGGLEWGKMSTTGLQNPLIRSLALNPTTPGLLYAGTQAAGLHVIPLAPPDNTAAPAAPSGETEIGAKLTSADGTWDGTKPMKYAYRWYSCSNNSQTSSCDEIAGETKKTYVIDIDDLGTDDYVRSRVSAKNVVTLGAGVDETYSAPTAAITGAAPNAPAISSFANNPSLSPTDSLPVGTTYTLTTGNWDTGAKAPTSYAYQWERCDSGGGNCVPIAGATSSTYTSTIADTTHRLRGQVTATNGSGNTTKQSKQTAQQVYRAKPVNQVKPSILGDAVPGGTLSSNAGVWKGEGIEYFRTWQACDADGTGCVSIIGADKITYTILGIYEGKRLRLRVEARNGQGSNFTELAYSDLTPVVKKPSAPGAGGGGAASGGSGSGSGSPQPPAPPKVVPQPPRVTPKPAALPLLTKAPALSGRARVGKRLKATTGAWTGATRFRFQWLRNGKAIKKATKGSYKLKRGDRGKRIACRITAIGAAGTTIAVTKAMKVR